MGDTVIVDGDQAMFLPTFGAATVVVRPGRMAGAVKISATGPAVCVEGDEKKVSVPGCPYVAPPHVIPGTGTLTIEKLGSDQLAKTTGSGKKLILKGSQFTAKFTVVSPAQQPQVPSPIADTTPSYTGNGQFVSTNISVTAS